jgi:hypothetical protein
MQNPNILFLDIDGVLISSRSRLAKADYPAFDPVSCGLVEKVSRHCGAKLVICSAWRENRSRGDFEAILSSIGISPDLKCLTCGFRSQFSEIQTVTRAFNEACRRYA